jgi:acetyl-CoA carboxylase carboxyltransferase component
MKKPQIRSASGKKIADTVNKSPIPYLAASHLHVDDVIDPAASRKILINALSAHIEKYEPAPPRTQCHAGLN